MRIVAVVWRKLKVRDERLEIMIKSLVDLRVFSQGAGFCQHNLGRRLKAGDFFMFVLKVTFLCP